MKFRPLLLLHYVGSCISRYSGGDRVTGAIGSALVSVPVTVLLTRLLFDLVFDPRPLFQRCCSFGPVTAKNPFSAPFVAYTLIVFPLAALLAIHVYRKSWQYSAEFKKPLWRFERWSLLLFILSLNLALPIGLQGNLKVSLGLCVAQWVTFIATTLAVALGVHRSGGAQTSFTPDNPRNGPSNTSSKRTREKPRAS